MAHFARVDDGIVREVIVIDNDDCGGGDFPESEAIGQAFIASIGLAGEFLQTSYSSSFRGTYAGQGFTYDSDLDEFVAPAAPEVETPIEP
jgi:hypothetical protein